MPAYAFSARDETGRERRGIQSALSESNLAHELRQRGWLILELRPTTPTRAQAPTSTFEWPFRGVRGIDVETSLRQLALMERGGVALLSALRAASEHARRPAMGRVWARIGARIETGSSLAAALELEPRVFAPLVRELVRAGEQSGSLALSFERAAEHLEQRRAIRSSVLQALLYPSIVLTLAIAVAGFMVFHVVPILEGFLHGSRHSLPPLTQALVSTSRVLRLYSAQILVVLAALFALVLFLDRWAPARFTLDRAAYRIPLLGRVRRLASTAVFARSLSVLGTNGVSIVRALELCEGILARPVAVRDIGRARARVLAGDNLAEGLSGARAFDPILPHMVAVGERSGTLDTILADVATHHEAELRQWIRRASAIIEPLITVVVGVVVGFVYIAFFLAVFAAAGAAG